MYDAPDRGEILTSDPRSVLSHQGTTQQFLKRYAASVQRAWGNGLRGIRALAPHLMARIADARTMRLAWDFLAQKGGSAPGPNGHRYRDYSSRETWNLCRCLAAAVRQGTYRPAPDHVIWIAKQSGHGQRPIVITDIEDRVVQRAIVIILQPILDRLFLATSFGYRPRLGHVHALARAERLTLSHRRRVWVIDDIRDAFLHVPLARLFQVVRRFVPADNLMALLERVVPGQSLPGLRQGGSLSPLLLNLYLHHFLDVPWSRAHPSRPLLRVADDLFVPCRNQRVAERVYAELSQLLLPTGMHLKGSLQSSIYDLGSGDRAMWLGFAIHKARRGLEFQIADRSWRRLEFCLDRAQAHSDSPLRARRSVTQWLAQRGPCYSCYTRSAREEVCLRIVRVARQHGFEELQDMNELMYGWKMAQERWMDLRRPKLEATRP